MEFSTLTSASLHQRTTQALAVGVFEDQQLSEAAEILDRASDGALRAVLQHEFKAKSGSQLVLRNVAGIKAERIVLVGLGKQEKYRPQVLSKAETAFAKYCLEASLTDAISALSSVDANHSTLRERTRLSAQALLGATYRFDQTLSQKADPITLKSVQIWVSPTLESEAQAGLQEGAAIGKGSNFTRLLADLPPNICTPTYLADQAKQLAKDYPSLKVEVLQRKQMEALKMGSFLSVAKGSVEPPVFIVIKHQPKAAADEAAPLVLVGKGLTFDAGGISLKPAAKMDEMKYDMAGAASVFGSMMAVAELELDQPVIGVVASCENLPSGTANKPGDVVTSMAGKTIEILNTDAEGRLVLCDALTYVERFKPAAVIDVATLTGACIVALGHVNTGLFSPDDGLAEELLAAAQSSGDAAWRLPLGDAYQEQLKSNFADIANIGGPAAGSVTAACFLQRFTEAYPWAHLDVAGTAWDSGSNKGATGRPVPLLVQFILNRQAQ
ncbi:MAG TPA: leucyl aminopeptidase [Candidatus Paenalcaligenes intestinipullorum]|uniref:Probable cytosol aminopeptidase n=1 Tax=Candidatus Paenalcaligenes intestinipullorum TaxID=2838718 RepID=A0A9D2RJT5_9BURK|nr:leucyl aminopeptidase [Candidatus Paenalcaligenes intestinipullorum]